MTQKGEAPAGIRSAGSHAKYEMTDKLVHRPGIEETKFSARANFYETPGWAFAR